MRYYTFFLMLFCQSAFLQISPNLAIKMTTNENVPVLIELKDQADLSGVNISWIKEQKANYVYRMLSEQAAISQTEVLNYLKTHSIMYRSFYVVNAIRAELNKDQIQEIASFPSVRKLSYDSYVNAIPQQDQTLHLTTRSPEITWGIQRVGADKVWARGYEGQGVVVAGSDTGIKWDGSAIKNHYRGYKNNNVDHNYNWHDAIHQNSPLSGVSDNPCGLSIKEPCDDNSHGTHTVGTMVGFTDEHAIGMAPKAEYIGCRNMERGNGAPSTYIECFEFFLAPTNLDGKNPKPELAPHVINNSWYCSLDEGCDTSTFPIMETVIENLRTAGVVVVVSAGNDGASCNTLNHIPALYKNSFSVGAMSWNDTISNFSSNGPVNNYRNVIIKPNVVAPGSAVVSQVPDGSFPAWYGTSMAGPHVAGLVALIISANPKLAGQVEQIETIIEETAEPFTSFFDCWPYSGTSIPNNTYGYGLINADKAVEKALKTVVGTIDEQYIDFKIFPNPAMQEFQIERQTATPTQFIIKDLMGKTMIIKNINSKYSTVDISNLNRGFYFISDEQNGKSYPLIKI